MRRAGGTVFVADAQDADTLILGALRRTLPTMNELLF
jgi:hypothetical protein